MSFIIFFVAYLAGVISFCASCFVPLIPLYLSYLVGENLNTDTTKFKNVYVSIFFGIGFFLSFMIFSVAALTFIKLLIPTSLSRVIIGLLMSLFGLVLILQNYINLPLFTASNGINNIKAINITSFKSINGLLFGLLLGLSWSPCISPLLGSFITLASSSNSILLGFILLVIYGIGLVTPFILIGLAYDRYRSYINKILVHSKRLKLIFGIIMILIGLNYIYNIININIDHLSIIEGDIGYYFAEKFLYNYK